MLGWYILTMHRLSAFSVVLMAYLIRFIFLSHYFPPNTPGKVPRRPYFHFES